METVSKRAYARAGLLGNPSDGYHGKTISFAIGEYWAETTLVSNEKIEFHAPAGNRFDSLQHFHRQISDQGYYGAERLLKATLKRFCDYCEGHHPLHENNFRLSFSSNIPRQVGLAGSSAIITSTLRSLMAWYAVDIPPHLLASLTLSVEQELGIPAGLQDRVIQAYQGVVFMDFSAEKMQQERGLWFGDYEPISPSSLSNLYIAFASNAGQPTEVLHNDLRDRFDKQDGKVQDAMKNFAEFAEQGRQAIENEDMVLLSKLIDRNFDQRAEICQLHPHHLEMVDCARAVGASAKFCGSGGAIVGVYSGQEMLMNLKREMKKIDCHVFEPTIV